MSFFFSFHPPKPDVKPRCKTYMQVCGLWYVYTYNYYRTRSKSCSIWPSPKRAAQHLIQILYRSFSRNSSAFSRNSSAFLQDALVDGVHVAASPQQEKGLPLTDLEQSAS